MKHRIVAFLVTLFCCATGFAGSIQADDISLKPGETKTLTLSLTSAVNNLVGVQFEVALPYGFTLETKDGTVCQLSHNQVSDMVCKINNRGNGIYRFILYSNSLLKLTDGELLSLNLKAGGNVALGNYTLSFHDVAFSDADGNVTKEDGITATIKLTNFFPEATNIVTPDVKIISGKTAPLTLKLLESIKGCVGIQFDLSLPEGFLLEKDGSGKECAISNNQASDVTCNLTVISNEVYRFMIYSNSLTEFVPGELMNINLKVSEEISLETYSVSIQDVQLSDIGGNVHNDIGTGANVKVSKYFTMVYKIDGVDYKSYDIEYEATITPEAKPEKEGYTFSGWSEIPATMPAYDVTVTGSFSVNSYTVTFKYGDEVLSTESVDYGAEIPLPESLDSDRYTLIEWLDVPATMPAYDIVIQASFTDAIRGIKANAQDAEYYQLNGIKQSKIQRGLNIVKTGDRAIKVVR